MIDFKLHRLVDNGKGNLSATVRFYEGEIGSMQEMNKDGKSRKTTRYRRTKLIGEETFNFNGNLKEGREWTKFLKKELKKRGDPIPEQDEVL